MKVLVVDDSTIYRKIVRDALAGLAEIEVVGVARDGHEALEKIRDLEPDLVTLDQEMPKLDGLGVLEALRTFPNRPMTVMISSLTAEGASVTARALRRGAFDFVLKPSGDSLESNRDQLQRDLERVVATGLATLQQRNSFRQAVAPARLAAAPACVAPPSVPPLAFLPPKVAVLGISTGGPSALAEFLPQLPASFPVPLLIVQHMPPVFTKSLADQLDCQCQIRVCEATQGELCLPGVAYIAPGGKQMRVAGKPSQLQIELTDDPEERSCKPSVNYLFRSVAQLVGGRTVAVIMTGMGDDGLAGCRLLKEAGAQIIAQDEASCVVYGMPRRVIEEGVVDVVTSLSRMAPTLMQVMDRGAVPCS